MGKHAGRGRRLGVSPPTLSCVQKSVLTSITVSLSSWAKPSNSTPKLYLATKTPWRLGQPLVHPPCHPRVLTWTWTPPSSPYTLDRFMAGLSSRNTSLTAASMTHMLRILSSTPILYLQSLWPSSSGYYQYIHHFAHYHLQLHKRRLVLPYDTPLLVPNTYFPAYSKIPCLRFLVLSEASYLVQASESCYLHSHGSGWLSIRVKRGGKGGERLSQ